MSIAIIVAAVVVVISIALKVRRGSFFRGREDDGQNARAYWAHER